MTTKAATASSDNKVRAGKTFSSRAWARMLSSDMAKKIAIGFIALLLLCYVISFFTSERSHPNVVEVSGRVEAGETHIVAATETRVTQVLVDEGEAVSKGQLLVTLDSENLQGRISSAGKMLSQANKAKVQADRQVSVVQRDVNEARKKSNGFWTKVFTSPKGRQKKREALKREMLQAKMMSFQARAAAAQAQSAISQAHSKISYFKLTSPIDGIVAVRSAEVGEIVGKGSVLLTIVDPKAAYMRAFIAEGDLAKVNIGQSADVYLGGNEVKPLKGKVVAIDTKPSFTPQNIYFKNDRLRQSFGMKIAIDNASGEAKPGVRADAKIDIKSAREEK